MVTIGLIYDVLRWEERALIKSAKREHINIKLIHIPSTHIYIDNMKRDISIDIGLQRCVSHQFALESTIAFEALGNRVVNNSYSIAVSNDKLWTTALLVKHNIPTPRVVIAFSQEQACRAIGKLKYPVVIKPLNGSWGRLVSLARDEEELRTIIEHRTYMPSPIFKIHYIQEFVKKPGRDIRAFVVGEEVPVAIYRISNHWITNTARGGKAVPAKIDPELEELILKVAKIIKGEILGVDIFEDPQRGYLINEVNSVTEFRNTVVVTGYDLPRKIINYLTDLVKR